MIPRARRFAFGVLAVAAIGCAGGCAGDDAEPPPATAPGTAAAIDGGCVLRLHGKGGGGGPATTVDGVTHVAPDGNAEGWGARQWLYFPEARYDEIVAALTEATAGCDAIVVNGFSNGAALAAKLYCRAETFGGALRGVVIDDPVPDHGVDGCAPAEGVPAVLYWTGALAGTATPGADCAAIDWTCEGGATIGIDAYAAALGLPISASPHTEHAWFTDAPELTEWLAG